MNMLLLDSLETRTLLASHAPITFGSSTYDGAYKVATLPDGGTIVAGLFSGVADFDPTSGKTLLVAFGKSDDPIDNTNAYVARYSDSGALVWVKQFASTEGEIDDQTAQELPIDPERTTNSALGISVVPVNQGNYVSAMQTDPSGNIYLAFAFRGSVDFDPGRARAVLTTADRGYPDIALVKLNGNGTLTFARQIGSRFTEVAQGMALDNSGNIYLTGYFARSTDFDPTSAKTVLTTKGREDIFIARYNPQGDLVWAKQNAGEAIDRNQRSVGYGIAVGTDAVYITGSFVGKTDFDTGSGVRRIDSVDETDIFVQKLSSADGSLVWVDTLGGDSFDAGLAIGRGPDNNIYVASIFSDTMDVDPSASRTINVTASPEDRGDDPKRSDLLIQKLDSNTGGLVWARPLGNGGWETLGGIAFDSVGNVVTTGAFYGSIDFDPGRGRTVLSSTPGVEDFDDPNDNDRDDSYDAFVQTLDPNGRLVAATRFGSASDDYATDVTIAPGAQRAVVVGQFRGTYVFNNTGAKLRPIGIQDSFVAIFETGTGAIVT